jgi:predicted DNA-binding protein
VSPEFTHKRNLNSKTATRLVREWIDLRINELQEDWELARLGKEVKKIAPLE